MKSLNSLTVGMAPAKRRNVFSSFDIYKQKEWAANRLKLFYIYYESHLYYWSWEYNKYNTGKAA